MAFLISFGYVQSYWKAFKAEKRPILLRMFRVESVRYQLMETKTTSHIQDCERSQTTFCDSATEHI